jgi:peptidoglycan/LPS O-acetylase OafA/YrhL
MSSPSQTFAPVDFKTRFPALDGVRALAVTMVFAHHYGGGYHGGHILQLINTIRLRGWMGVDFFFVLSGFLITGILYDTRADSRYFRRFFARRSVRIFPVYYLVFTVLLLLTPIFQYQWHWLHLTFLVYLGNFFANYNFSLYNLVSATHPAANVEMSHLWSLCVEEQFYLLWPLAVWLIRDRIRLLWTAATLCGLALALRIAMELRFTPDVASSWIGRTLPFRMDTLLMGGILALLLRGPAADLWQRRICWVFFPGLAGTLAIFYFSPIYNSVWLHTIGFTLISLLGVGLICSTLRHRSLVGRFFHLKPLRTLGKYSYGFYIFHLLFQPAWLKLLIFSSHWVHSIALNGILVIGLNFATVFLVSKLSYDLFEVRFLRLKRHVEYDSELTEHKHAFTTR